LAAVKEWLNGAVTVWTTAGRPLTGQVPPIIWLRCRCIEPGKQGTLNQLVKWRTDKKSPSRLTPLLDELTKFAHTSGDRHQVAWGRVAYQFKKLANQPREVGSRAYRRCRGHDPGLEQQLAQPALAGGVAIVRFSSPEEKSRHRRQNGGYCPGLSGRDGLVNTR
jgi:hypothetical protein